MSLVQVLLKKEEESEMVLTCSKGSNKVSKPMNVQRRFFKESWPAQLRIPGHVSHETPLQISSTRLRSPTPLHDSAPLLLYTTLLPYSYTRLRSPTPLHDSAPLLLYTTPRPYSTTRLCSPTPLHDSAPLLLYTTLLPYSSTRLRSPTPLHYSAPLLLYTTPLPYTTLLPYSSTRLRYPTPLLFSSALLLFSIRLLNPSTLLPSITPPPYSYHFSHVESTAIPPLEPYGLFRLKTFVWIYVTSAYFILLK
ncbi:unnamed protein product [Nesidiocoris tenuis]|uniref:Uncharacterized protein n=1 Tax=Nesidiocoris tenuis TaxID=355587 RepID=A0A6H5G483_9HEMI|nr:unnamed protein product [Nesidiocoris tenuis]